MPALAQRKEAVLAAVPHRLWPVFKWIPERVLLRHSLRDHTHHRQVHQNKGSKSYFVVLNYTHDNGQTTLLQKVLDTIVSNFSKNVLLPSSFF